MKKINYRQYYYNGDYANTELQVPDECGLYEIGLVNMSHQVRDSEKETWTKAYALLCPTEFEDSILLGNVYFNYIDDVFITNSEIAVLDVESAPRFSGVYSVEYYKDMESESKFSAYLSKIEDVEKASPNELGELVEIAKECKKICSIRMLRKITRKGIEVSNICFRDWVYGEAMASMNISNIEFGKIFWEEFTTDKDISELFLKESEKIYKSIINNE